MLKASQLNSISTGQKYQNITHWFISVDLKEASECCIDVVSLADCSMVNYDGMLTSLNIDNFCTSAAWLDATKEEIQTYLS